MTAMCYISVDSRLSVATTFHSGVHIAVHTNVNIGRHTNGEHRLSQRCQLKTAVPQRC